MIPQLSVKDLKKLLDKDCAIIDTRSPEIFASGFIPGSVFLNAEQQFEKWATTFLSKNRPVAIIAEEGNEETVARQLLGLGFKKIEGFLDGGFNAWKSADQPVDLVINIDADEFEIDARFDKNMVVIDLRPYDEYKLGYIQDAINLPLAEMADVAQIASLDEEGFVYFYGANDAESATAASLMKVQGLHRLRIINGGWDAIQSLNNITVSKIKENKKAI